jgi:hypothetical protein
MGRATTTTTTTTHGRRFCLAVVQVHLILGVLLFRLERAKVISELMDESE